MGLWACVCLISYQVDALLAESRLSDRDGGRTPQAIAGVLCIAHNPPCEMHFRVLYYAVLCQIRIQSEIS